MFSRSCSVGVTSVWRLRSFLNTDTPSLASIWSEHHQASNSRSLCPVHCWEQCVFSKAYFRSQDFIVACDAREQLVGFIHFGPSLEADECGLSSSHGLIHRLCIVPGPDDGLIASLLVNRALASLKAQGLSYCHALGTPTESIFYLGLADGDNLIGVTASDPRLVRWLNAAGLTGQAPTECWELSLDTFRPPMDRLQISVRRTCSIGRILDEYHPNWWVSTILGHCEQVRFHLMVRGVSNIDHEVMLWYPDSTIRGVDSSTVRLRMPEMPDDAEDRERFICLFSEAIRQLQQERKRTVRVVATSDKPLTTQVLQRLGFRSMETGLVFGRAL